MKLSRWLLLFFIGLLFQGISFAADPDPAGKVGYVRGVVSAKSSIGGSRLLTKDTPIFATDSIVTGGSSFVVLAFKDGTKITIRPNSVFVIKAYRFKKDNNDKASFRLAKGGLRAVTGGINKNKGEKMRITTPVATMGIRGTDFIARLCDGDCSTTTAAKDKKKSDTVARLALAKGVVKIKSKKGTRTGKTGDRLKAKDTIVTDKKGFAVLVFDDNTRVTVQPKTELSIATYTYPKGRPKQGKVLLSLKKGGARTLTGRIGKSNPKGFKIKTPSATMGIRGTGFDTHHDGKTHVTVWQGGVTATQGGATQNINLNQTFQIGNNGFNQLAQLPPNLAAQFRSTPRPDKAKTQSIWVSVKSGKVTLTKNKPDGSKGSSTAGGKPRSGKSNNKNDSGATKTTGKKNDDSDADGESSNEGDKADDGGVSEGNDGEETIELSAGETGVANETETSEVSESPGFITKDPYTATSPGNVEATSDVFGNPGSDNKSCIVN